eukprot:3332496-Ditylum_brightwellii.AAC.1
MLEGSLNFKIGVILVDWGCMLSVNKEDYSTQTLCKCIKGKVVIATIQVKAHCIRKALHLPNDVINIWKQIRAAEN